MRAKQSICYRQVEETRIDFPITADNYTFDTINEFINLDSAVTTKNYGSLEIQRRIALPNTCYYGLNGQLSNRDLSCTTKRILCKTLILLVLLYCVEDVWTLLSSVTSALEVFERKVLRKIFGSVRVGVDFRIRFISELYELLNGIDILLSINIVFMEEGAPARRLFDAGICGSRCRGRPCIRWNDQIE